MGSFSYHVGQRIKKYRKSRGYTIEQFSAMINKSKATLSKYENGTITIDIETLYDIAQALNIDLVVLAGFMVILTSEMVQAFPNAILNVHPALIPSFAGPGCYGLHVHEKALEYGVKLSGATVHFVSEECDGGPIVAQKAVEVLPDDTPEVLQRRIMENCEWKLLPQAVSLFCQGRLKVEGRTVRILD